MKRDLIRIGATEQEARAYVDGLRRGGAIAFATGSDENVEAAAKIMNLRGAIEVETVTGAEPSLPAASHPTPVSIRDESTMAGRGSWANTQKLAGRDRWQFPLYYWDYAIGVFALGLVSMLTLGSIGGTGASAIANLQQASAGVCVCTLLGSPAD